MSLPVLSPAPCSRGFGIRSCQRWLSCPLPLVCLLDRRLQDLFLHEENNKELKMQCLFALLVPAVPQSDAISHRRAVWKHGPASAWSCSPGPYQVLTTYKDNSTRNFVCWANDRLYYRATVPYQTCLIIKQWDMTRGKFQHNFYVPWIVW